MWLPFRSTRDTTGTPKGRHEACPYGLSNGLRRFERARTKSTAMPNGHRTPRPLGRADIRQPSSSLLPEELSAASGVGSGADGGSAVGVCRGMNVEVDRTMVHLRAPKPSATQARPGLQSELVLHPLPSGNGGTQRPSLPMMSQRFEPVQAASTQHTSLTQYREWHVVASPAQGVPLGAANVRVGVLGTGDGVGGLIAHTFPAPASQYMEAQSLSPVQPSPIPTRTAHRPGDRARLQNSPGGQLGSEQHTPSTHCRDMQTEPEKQVFPSGKGAAVAVAVAVGVGGRAVAVTVAVNVGLGIGPAAHDPG